MEKNRKLREYRIYSRVTRLSLSQVTWNQVQGSTKVGSQLPRTPFGSFTALLNAYRASPVDSKPWRLLTISLRRNSQESVLNINHSTSIRRLKILFLPSKFAFEGAKRIGKRRTAARRWNIAQIFISKSWKLWLELENLKGEFKVKMLMNTVCQFLREREREREAERERDSCLFLLSKEAWNLNFVVRIYRAHKRTASCLANQNNDSQFPTIPIFIFVCIGVKVELKEGEGILRWRLFPVTCKFLTK